jgi:glycosyltransferase involved in cell wall biosynthesis
MALTDDQPLLAAVVICRNEERWIAGCLDSVLDAVAPFPGCEVVVVDSASDDETVARARRFPVRVLEVQRSAPRSAALGRLVGERATRSRYLLFVDGDTEIRSEWVRAAVAYLEAHPTVAGVAGKLHEIYFEGDRQVGENPDCFGAGPEPEEVDQLGGNAIYRRAALDAVGSWNPYVVSYEEAELAERLRLAGGSVVRLPIVLGTHRTGRPGTLAELRRRRRENLIKGYGQALRLGLRNGTFRVHAGRMTRYLQFIAGCAAGAVALLAGAVTGNWWLVAAWLLGVAALLAAFAVKSRSITKPLALVLDWAFWSGPLVRGFLERPRDPRALKLADLVTVEHAPAARSSGSWPRAMGGTC